MHSTLTRNRKYARPHTHTDPHAHALTHTRTHTRTQFLFNTHTDQLGFLVESATGCLSSMNAVQRVLDYNQLPSEEYEACHSLTSICFSHSGSIVCVLVTMLISPIGA